MKVNERDRRLTGRLPDAVTLFVKDVRNLDVQTLTKEEEMKYFSQVENGRASYLLLRLLAPNDPWVEKEFRGYLSNESAQEFLSARGFKPYVKAVKAQENNVETKKKRSKSKEENPDKELEFEGDTIFVLTNIGYSFTNDDLTLLRRHIDKGKEAKEQIVNHNLKWVISHVSSFERRGLDKDELIQEGNIGLLRAVEKFDRRLGFKFLTYSTYWIDQAVRRAIADTSRTIRLPVHMHGSIGRFLEIYRALTNRLGRYPENTEIAREWGISIESVIKISEALERAGPTDSLDYLVGEDERSTVEDFVADLSILDFGDSASKNEIIERIRRLFLTRPNGLSEKEAQVLWFYFGLDKEDEEGRTLQETGHIVGLSRERIRQIARLALAKMEGLKEIKELAEE